MLEVSDTFSNECVFIIQVLLALDASVWIMDNKSATGTTPHDLARGHKANIEDLLGITCVHVYMQKHPVSLQLHKTPSSCAI